MALQNLSAQFAIVGRLMLIRNALWYDLSVFPLHEKAFTGPAGVMWQTLMNAWNAAQGRTDIRVSYPNTLDKEAP